MRALTSSAEVLGIRVDRVDYAEAVDRVLLAASERRKFSVAAANVHVVMEAHDDPELAGMLERFELVVPDGQPIRWMLDALGEPKLDDRVYGPELMRRLCQAAEAARMPIYLFGTTPEVLASLGAELERRFPRLEFAGAHAPGFGEQLWASAPGDVATIAASGARLLFVALGCPRQERWVALHAESLGIPCVAVGAAFDLLAGRKPMAPRWLQDRGLEWLHRLLHEPRRTWKRYLVHNPRFVVGAAWGLLQGRFPGVRLRSPRRRP